MSRIPAFITMALLVATAPTTSAQLSVVDGPHNLSASGPGAVRAVAEEQVCIFCHAPHRTSGATPLWNRSESSANYVIYSSSTLDAQPGQPIGASKYCLSCHDGTIALGAVASEPFPIAMAGSQVLIGSSSLGTDLSDDHPISFHYSSGLAAADPQLRDPSVLPPEVRLVGGMLECTTCHDPHDNALGNFLVVPDAASQLCNTCHQMIGWSSSPHESSAALVGSSGSWPYATVHENGCRSCHRPHSAGKHERLLIFPDDEQNCLSCHAGQVATKNILAELDKFSSHDPRLYQDRHDPVEEYYGGQPHVECTDCHNPHAAQAIAPGGQTYKPIGNTLLQTRGYTIGGAPVAVAQFEYEVCFRCHGDSAVPISGTIPRQSETGNLRLDFSPSNPSYHPLAAAVSNPNVPSLKPGLTWGTLMRCTDCHNNNQGSGGGGVGPKGPHGSIYEFLLERNYTTTDPNSESGTEYAMCYKCHERSSILGDQSFDEHELHVREEDTPCSVCHDPHGVSGVGSTGGDHTHLINFDLRVVSPSPTTGTLLFEDRGTFSGSCTLLCHGENHVDEDY